MPIVRHIAVFVLVATFVPTAGVYATPPNKAALIEFLGPVAPAKAIDCRICHINSSPTPEDQDRNPFGERLASLRSQLRKAGKPHDIRVRLQMIVDEDSDGDGVSNIIELLTGHAPGDQADQPNAQDLTRAATLRAQLNKHLAAYRWRPFEAVVRPAVPKLTVAAPELTNPIDLFLEDARREQKLAARPVAAKSVLLRRVMLDLTGLPPTPAEQDAFENDDRPDAYERLIDRLLASPRYGERWGRHWMDVWRYSDWAGFGAEIRESQPHIWQWRDWIIESLNANAGYDRMVREMIAGDELAPTDPAVLRATGFLVRQYYKFNRNIVLDSTVEHTAKAFLGITMNCARCHDHMYDPISQREYFSFKAIFAPVEYRMDRIPGEPNVSKAGLVRAYDLDKPPITHVLIRGDEKSPDESQVCEPGVPASLAGCSFTVAPVPLPRDASHPNQRQFVIEEDRAAARAAIATVETALKAAQKQVASALMAAWQPNPDVKLLMTPIEQLNFRKLALAQLDVAAAQAAYASFEATLQAEQAEEQGKLGSTERRRAAELAVIVQRQHALAKARRDLCSVEVAHDTAVSTKRMPLVAAMITAKAALTKAETDVAAPLHANFARRPQTVYASTSTGRRLALARWITDRSNPLAARVAVNHVWTRHFGQPLVPTVFDFGRNGKPPTHPALVDWLAADFMDHGWSLKHLHKRIVMSAAYCQDSHSDAANVQIDPDNRFYWRMNSRRMEAEVVRDSLLAIAGQLDLQTGGPELDHTQGLTSNRRSVYYRHANEKQMQFLAVFDPANVNECYQRSTSVVPQQALALANSSLTRDAARAIATRISRELGNDANDNEFVLAAFRNVLARPPTIAELNECRVFLDHPDRNATRTRLIHVLLNHNDFVTIR